MKYSQSCQLTTVNLKTGYEVCKLFERQITEGDTKEVEKSK